MKRLNSEIEATGKSVLDAAYEVHTELGPGLLESIYQQCLAYLLTEKGHSVAMESPIPIQFRDRKFDCGFRADLIVDEMVLIELKAVEQLTPIYTSQILTYLRLSTLQLGYLINFNVLHLKDGVRRFIRPDLLSENRR